MLLYKKDITGIYDKLKSCAFKAYNYGFYNKCLNYINISARIAYKFSWIFKDDDYETLLKKLSKSLLKQVEYYMPNENRYVFYDAFSCDNQGLTQQYVRALMTLKVHFLYISESSQQNSYSKDILEEISGYKNAIIFEVPKYLKRTQKIELIYKQIISYSPVKLFMHLRPQSINAITAFYALPKKITKYQINLTDHAFWLGAGCLDFSLEFRPYGCSLSASQRNIAKERILLVPYYPVVSKTQFQGFPQDCKGKVIVFSGGSYFKILGDNDLFLNLVKQLLLDNSNAIFLFAGSGDSTHIENFINGNGLEKRFILLGHRTDINEVFKHCDIYMSTYPLGGGLMAQYAAINGIPIISYSTIDKNFCWPEETVCQLKKIKITYNDADEFLSESKKVISDSAYRLSTGENLKQCIVTMEKFNWIFHNSINDNINQVLYDMIDVDVNLQMLNNIDIENITNESKILLIRMLKFKILFISPKIFFWALTFIFTKSFRSKVYKEF